MGLINMAWLLSAAPLSADAFSAGRQLMQTPFVWPLYSQQCEDDAGPPFMDDSQTFGPNGRYHDGSQATAVLKNGECAGPVKDSCNARRGNGPLTERVARAAYLEGPIQCGNKGWFCRIIPDVNHHNPEDPRVDWNFNLCNRTDYGDYDGHCHGSDNDDTYYWWVRDHWHRNYAGRLRCCCDWKATAGVVARCDYRAPLQPGQWEECRDANEEHTGPGSGFSLGYEAGCPNLGQSPLPEPDDAQCWDVSKFAPGGGAGGFTWDGYTFGGGQQPTTSPPGPPTPSAPPSTSSGACVDDMTWTDDANNNCQSSDITAQWCAESGNEVFNGKTGNQACCICGGGFTAASPTPQPPTTSQPTTRPTTKQPTKQPTTKQPTKQPTTKQPTKQPTTKQPTKAPTKIPTTKQPTTKAPTPVTGSSPTPGPSGSNACSSADGSSTNTFDWGQDCRQGSGSFQLALPTPSQTKPVGCIPVGKFSVSIRLTAKNDIDISLFDSSSGRAIVQWCSVTQAAATPDSCGLLGGPAAQWVLYEGMNVTYSGYNGDGTGRGNEYITIQGMTTVPMEMRAFAYRTGDAHVDYSWAKGCGGTFTADLARNQASEIGVIPPGVQNVQVSLQSPVDLDIQLYDLDAGDREANAIIAFCSPHPGCNWGPLTSSGPISGLYQGLTYHYSGWNGLGKKGHESITIDGTTNRNLRMLLYAYRSGQGTVSYSYDSGSEDARTGPV